MIVKDRTQRQKLAGAIAGRVRSSEAIFLLAQGAEAVANAVSAICHARMFLEVWLACACMDDELRNQYRGMGCG